MRFVEEVRHALLLARLVRADAAKFGEEELLSALELRDRRAGGGGGDRRAGCRGPGGGLLIGEGGVVAVDFGNVLN